MVIAIAMGELRGVPGQPPWTLRIPGHAKNPLPPKTRNPPLIHNLRCNCTVLAGYSERIFRYPAIRGRRGIFRKTPPKKSRNRPVAGTRNRRIGARYGPGWVVLPGRGGYDPYGIEKRCSGGGLVAEWGEGGGESRTRGGAG